MAIERLDGNQHDTRSELLRLRRLAMRDELTGLANRRGFLQRLRDEIARSRRHGTPFSLVLLDLDGLKDLNDTFGHQAGDAALKHFARALERAVRQEDMAARIGGDEFAVVAVHGHAEEALPFVERISGVARGLARRVAPKTRPVWLSAAWGSTVWEPGVADAEELFARAEAALLSSKQTGVAGSPPVPATEVYQPRGRRALGEELRRLLAMARDVSTARELEDLCRAAAEQAAALAGASMASLALRGPDGRTGYAERLVNARWVPATEWFADGHGLIGGVMVSGEPAVVNDLSRDTQADQSAVRRFAARNTMCLPLRGQGGRTLGVLSLTNKLDDRGFTRADVELALGFADLVASAIENVRAREEAEEAHSYLKTLMDQAHDAIYITDPDTRCILDANAAASVMIGYSRDELLTMRAPDLRPPADRDVPGTTDLVLEAGGVLAMQLRHQRKDGATIPVEVSARLVMTSRGQVVMNIVRDVSARVAAEESLRRRSRDLQARNDVATILAESLDPATVLTRTLEVIVDATGADGGLATELHPDTGVLSVVAELQVPEPLRSHVFRETNNDRKGLLAGALAGQALVIEDALADPRVLRTQTRDAGVRSLALVPMRARGIVLGVLAVGAYAPSRFGAAEVALLQSLADQVGLWQENRRLLAEARQREADALFLAELGDALNRARTVEQVVRLLVRKTGTVLGRAAAVLLRDPDADGWSMIRFHHPQAATRAAIARLLAESPPRATGGLTHLAVNAREPLLLDLHDRAVEEAIGDGLRRTGVHQALVAPLRAGNRTIGVFVTGATDERDPLVDRHRRLAAEICRHGGVALANAMARADLLKRNRELRLISQIADAAQRSGSTAQLFDRMVRRLHQAFRPAGAVLRLWDEQAGVLPMVASAGFSEEVTQVLGSHAPRLGERLAGMVAQSRQPLLTADVQADPSIRRGSTASPNFRAMMAVPLVVEQRLIGVLTMVSARPGTFSAADLQLLLRVSQPMAAALARIQAYDRAESAGRYTRALIDNAADAVFVMDPVSKRVVDTNPAAEHLTGYTRAELLGLEDHVLRPAREQHALTSTDLAVRHGRFTNRAPAFVRRKDGAEVQIEVSASVMQSPAGRVVLNLVRDVTARVAGQARLRFQSQVLDAVRDAVIAVGLDREVIYWNAGAAAIFGWTAAEITGRPVDRIVPQGQEASIEENIRRGSMDDGWKAECPRLHKDGRVVWCSMHFSPLRDQHGTVTGVLAVVRDVTERRAAEEALARARDEAARRAAEFAAAARASKAVVGGGSPRSQLERLARHIVEVTGFDAATVQSYDAQMDVVRIEAVHHVLPRPPARLMAMLDKQWTGGVLAEFRDQMTRGEVQVFDSVADAPADAVAAGHWARHDGFAMMVRMPLVYNGQAEGTCLLASVQRRDVAPEDVRLYRTLADQVSIVAHNLIEYERVREMRRDAIFRLAQTCEARDPETVPHLQSVFAVTEALGRELGLAGDELEDLALSSVLHDAGKIRTPDTILWKPARLGAEEMAIVRLHTMYGEQLLAGPEFYATARGIARHHHERWDGSGYPDGLAGEAIPLAARIVAVSDVFDSMTVRRVYRPAWPVERAAEEIIANAGRLFDPRVVEAFESLYRAGRLPCRPTAMP